MNEAMRDWLPILMMTFYIIGTVWQAPSIPQTFVTRLPMRDWP